MFQLLNHKLQILTSGHCLSLMKHNTWAQVQEKWLITSFGLSLRQQLITAVKVFAKGVAIHCQKRKKRKYYAFWHWTKTRHQVRYIGLPCELLEVMPTVMVWPGLHQHTLLAMYLPPKEQLIKSAVRTVCKGGLGKTQVYGMNDMTHRCQSSCVPTRCSKVYDMQVEVLQASMLALSQLLHMHQRYTPMQLWHMQNCRRKADKFTYRHCTKQQLPTVAAVTATYYVYAWAWLQAWLLS